MFRILKNIFRKFFRPIFIVLKNTFVNYQNDKVHRMGASLAYYTIFSLPAIIIIIIGLVGFFLGQAAVEGKVYTYIVDMVGESSALQIQNAVKNIGSQTTNWWATVLGVGFLIFIATNIFYALQEALNTIFGVQEVPQKVKLLQALINRVLSFGMILSIGALLVISILLNGVLLAVSNILTRHKDQMVENLPEHLVFTKPYLDYFTNNFLVFANLGLSIFLIALFFALMYQILPAVRLGWRFIWSGALFSAILFWVGELLLGYYLSKASFVSAYGAAGSLIVVLIWVYYSAQLVFIGAEFIKALCNYRGASIRPTGFAKKLQNSMQPKLLKRRRKDEEGNIIEFLESSQ